MMEEKHSMTETGSLESSCQAYKAITRICLNNWHYIDQKVLNLNKSINFFTGHSGSGKSTVIDALQIVLYANTDGRSFFNKAAADDSDRSLMEYLRGMINIGENGQAEYKRNRNFSAAIVLELEQTGTGERECVGIVFDVDTSANDYGRLFFWHKGGLPHHFYRSGDRAMTIGELKEYLQSSLQKEEQFYTSSNERFRRNLYDIYLGGLDMEKFPRLFKRAIPFRMNIKLEDFVREYICMEQDIHMEDMQESVVLYGRMRRRIEEAAGEIRELEAIGEQYRRFREADAQTQDCRYRLDQLEILALERSLREQQAQLEEWSRDKQLQEQSLEKLMQLKEEYQQEYDEINRQMASSGYADLEVKLADLESNISLLERSRRKMGQLAERLALWEEEDAASNQLIWDVKRFQRADITGEELERLKRSLNQVREDVEKQRQEASSELRSLQKERTLLDKDLTQIRQGNKAYPRELEEARSRIQKGLYERTGKNIPVRILADLLDIRDEKWRNAIEGYLGANKLALMVEPKYLGAAMEIYEELDYKRFWRVSLVDTQKLTEQEEAVRKGALAEEVSAKEGYVRAFVSFLLGNVIKCGTVEELRRHRMGVTADCMLYQNYQLRRLNPDYYTRKAYIGEKSIRRRQKELQERLEELDRRIGRYQEAAEDAGRILKLEFLSEPVSEYLDMLRDIEELRGREELKKRLLKRMEEIGADTVERLREKRASSLEKQKALDRQIDECKLRLHDREREIEKSGQAVILKNEELLAKRRELSGSPRQEERFAVYLQERKTARYERLIRETQEEAEQARNRREEEKNRLVDIRSAYLRGRPNREFSASSESNQEYQGLLDELACDRIQEYQEKAGEQGRIAVEHFKEDFVYKIRSAIKEAFIRRDELNRIIRGLHFGKDKYQFRITRGKGVLGEYYDMFMDESLAIDPASLPESMERQVNLFSMEHESKYGELMEELIRIFIPPESANAREQEEALRNMEKYADYRTYLSFEMEQIVEGEERLVIGLSKMIKKNSGGEGQNPLYVALLASFAQAYHINLASGHSRRPGIRLVVLDEAFSKMDAEKVASCIDLIRSLGFQAIISATNDKIQNYLENVDKTFVYANPNKKSISIQEFEKKDFNFIQTSSYQ